MSYSFLFCISVTLLVLTLTVESVYNPFLYDDGHGGEEHCCLVRVREKFCWATPITRSLIQVNQQCSRFQRSKHNRYGEKREMNNYLGKISRRLNVQTIHEIDDKIFIQLQKPLEKNITESDLICLTSTNNNINLEKCYVELVDDSDEHYISYKERKRRQHRGGDRHKESSISEDESDIDERLQDEETDAEKEARRIELAQPVQIREGRGLSVRRKYTIDPKHIQANHREQRKCWSWYQQLTQKLQRNSKKYSKYCINLNYPREKCLNQLIYNRFNNSEQEQLKKVSFNYGSRLYCENTLGDKKLLGHYNYGEICFYPNNQVYIDHEFTDIASLSDMTKNHDALEFIKNNSKLSAEFGDDCHEQTNFVENNEE